MLAYATNNKSFKKRSISGGHEDANPYRQVQGVTISLHRSYLFVSTGNIAAFGGSHRLVDRPRVAEFSASSAKRMRRYLRSCVANYVNMITLTYPFTFPLDGRTCKEHLRRFLQELKREAERNGYGAGFSAFWFIEFQERGAPHFHILTTWSPMDFSKGKASWVKATWFRIVGSDDDRHLVSGTREERLKAGRDGTIAYATKYAEKTEQKSVPEKFEGVGRFWGVCGLRTTMCAVIQIDSETLRSDPVKEVYTHLLDIMKRACACARARVCVRKEGFLMIHVKELTTLLRLRCVMNMLAAETVGCQSIEDSLFLDAEVD